MLGKLIVLEGGEGCGKSTQLSCLEQWLTTTPQWQTLLAAGRVQGLLSTREPGGTDLGKALRQILLGQGSDMDIGPQAELLLYAADRAQHVTEFIKPALAAGYWVLCDRYIDSTVAYQGYGRGLDLALIEQLNTIATGGLGGDLTLWLEIEAEAGLERTRQRGTADRMEQADLEFHQRVQQGFACLQQQHSDRIVAIPATGDIASVSQQIQQVVEQRIQQWYGIDSSD